MRIIPMGKKIAHDTKSRIHDVSMSDSALRNTAYRLSLSNTIPAAHPPIYVRINVEFGS
jgi:hypothetical protein